MAFRSVLTETIAPEISLEYEHAGEEFYVSYAFIDLAVSTHMTARVGYFVAPVGAFNEYQYADFMRRTAQAPTFGRDMLPALWSEVGVRGKFPFGKDRNVNYAVFVSNGLEQPDPDPEDGVAADSGSLRSMRRNFRDEHDASKAVGGRLGLALGPDLNLGLSGYTGPTR